MSIKWFVVPKGTELGSDYYSVAISIHETEGEADVAARRLRHPWWPFARATECELIRRFTPS